MAVTTPKEPIVEQGMMWAIHKPIAAPGLLPTTGPIPALCR